MDFRWFPKDDVKSKRSLRFFDPISAIIAVATWIGNAIVAGTLALQIGGLFGASGFFAWAIGETIITIGLTVIGIGVTAIFVHQPNAPTMDAAKVNVRLSESDRWIIAGNVRSGGAVVFAEFDDKGNIWYVVVHSDSILIDTVNYFFDDVPIVVNGSNNVITDEFCTTDKGDPYVTGVSVGSPVTYYSVWSTTYSETDPVPPILTDLATAFPTLWDSDHKLVGTTFSVVRGKGLAVENRYKIYRWRGPLGMGEPAISIVGNWSHCYDPRDGSQVNGDATTYSDTKGNTALIWAWFRTHIHGRQKSIDSVNWDMVAAQADICDETVTGITGTHTRYKCAIAIPESLERSSAEQQILMSADCQLVFDDDGKCWPRVGHYDTPTLHLSRNRDILAMQSVEAQNSDSLTQGVIVRYIDPDANYTTQPSAAWKNPLYYDAGQGNTYLTVDILACQDHNQAMRLAKAIGYRSQPPHKLQPTISLRGLQARKERIVNLNYDNTFFGDYEIVTNVEIDASGIICGCGLVPVDENRWDLLAGEELPKPVALSTSGTDIPDPPAVTSLTYVSGQLKAIFAPPDRDDVTYQFQYILASDLALGDPWIDMAVQMTDLFALSGSVIEGDTYDVQYRSVTSGGNVSAWTSPPLSITIGTVLAPSQYISVTGSTGSVAGSWRNPNDVNFDDTDIWRGTTTVFGAATKIVSAMAGGLGQIQTFTDTITAGTYYYWAVARATDGTLAVPTGPATAVVT